MSQKRLATTLGVAIVLGSGLFALPASAEVIINIVQDSNGVVATGSGTFDITDLFAVSGFNASPGMNASISAIELGVGTGTGTVYAPIPGQPIFSGPSNFGSGTLIDASSGQGDIFGLCGCGGIAAPTGYVSGNTLSGSATWDGATFSSLGLTTGTYVWTWGSGADADSFTLQIGAVPAPPIGRGLPVLLAVGGLLLGAKLLERSKRRRLQFG